MQRWISYTVTFISTLALGSIAAWLFTANITTATANLADPDIPRIIFQPSSEIADFNPEFRNVNIPDADEDIPLSLQLAFDGGFSLRDCELEIAKPNVRWLGLFKNGKLYTLERRRLRVGGPESDDFGIWHPIRFRNSKGASFLFTDDGRLKPRTARTLDENPRGIWGDSSLSKGMALGFTRQFNLGGINYTIRVAPGTNDGGFEVGVLVIESREKQQILNFRDLVGGSDMEIADLDWVGDLDGDGLLDLRISYYNQNGGGLSSILFLSSTATGSGLVKPYASFHTRFYRC